MKRESVAILLAFVSVLEAFSPIRYNNVRNLISSIQSQPTLTGNDVFYPTPAVSLDGLSEDEVLYDLFLRQFVGDDVETKPFYESDEVLSARGYGISKGNIIQRVVEVPVPLIVDTPLEIVYKSRVAFGNFVARKMGKNGVLSSTSLLVRLVSGEVITIDVGQIVSCWDQLADEGVPRTPTDWAQVRTFFRRRTSLTVNHYMETTQLTQNIIPNFRKTAHHYFYNCSYFCY